MNKKWTFGLMFVLLSGSLSVFGSEKEKGKEKQQLVLPEEIGSSSNAYTTSEGLNKILDFVHKNPAYVHGYVISLTGSRNKYIPLINSLLGWTSRMNSDAKAPELRVQLLKYLISNKADIEIEDAVGDRPLFLASMGASPEIMQLLIAAGIHLNKKGRRETADYQIVRGVTPLMIAAAYNLPVVTLLARAMLAKNIDINMQDSKGDTALHYAIGNNKVFLTIRTLIELGASPLIKNFEGKTVLDALHERAKRIASFPDMHSDIIEAITFVENYLRQDSEKKAMQESLAATGSLPPELLSFAGEYQMGVRDEKKRRFNDVVHLIKTLNSEQSRKKFPAEFVKQIKDPDELVSDSMRDEFGHTIIHIAADQCKSGIISWLLKAKFSDLQLKYTLFAKTNIWNQTALDIAEQKAKYIAKQIAEATDQKNSQENAQLLKQCNATIDVLRAYEKSKNGKKE